MTCNNCGKNKEIKNKHFNLCLFCNQRRLERLKKESDTFIPITYKSRTQGLKTSLNSLYYTNKFPAKETTAEKIKKDDDFYEICFNMSDHLCEECGNQLPTAFRDDDGRVNARWRYSHIVPKSIASSLRRDPKNINHLCLECHAKWEHKNKKKMKIYKKNKKRFPQYF